MKKLIAVALIPLVASPGPALADGCRRVSYSGGYVTHQTYPPPVYHYDPYALVVAKAVPVFVNLNAYATVSDDVRRFYDLKRAVKEGTLEAMLEMQGNQPSPSPGPSPAPVDPPVPPLGAPKAIPKGATGKATGIKGILTARCASCHSPKDPDRVDLSGDPDRIPATVAGLCATQVSRGAMPKKNGPLSDVEFDTVIGWADEKLAAAAVSKR